MNVSSSYADPSAGNNSAGHSDTHQPPPPPSPSSSSSDDAYDRQDVSSVLPPSRRSSLSTATTASRRNSSAGAPSGFSWLSGSALNAPETPSSTTTITAAHVGEPQRGGEFEVAPAFAGPSASSQPRRTPSGAAMFADSGSARTDMPETLVTYTATTALRRADEFSAAAEAAAPPVVVVEVAGGGLRNPFIDDSDASAATPPRSAAAEEASSGVPASLLRYRFAETTERESPADATPSRTLMFPPPSNSNTMAVTAAAVSAPSPEDSTVNSVRPGAGVVPSVASAPPTEMHVRFSSEIDVVEAASHGSASTTPADPYTTVAQSEEYDIDESEEAEGGGGLAGAAFNSSRNSKGGVASTSSRHDRRAHETVAPRALPQLLSADELQMERLKAYDRAGRSARSGHVSDAHGSESAPMIIDDGLSHGEPPAASHAGGGGGSAGASPTQRSSTAAFGAGGREDREEGGGGGGDEEEEGRLDEPEVSTLDFLADTTTTILPDAFTSMFASTAHFLKSKTGAMVSAVPQPIRRAMSKTGEGIASAADKTGSVLSNVGVYAMRGVPDRVLSPEWKYLIFVDAANVLKCSLTVNILVAPYIFRMAGLVGGLLMIVLVQAICCYYTEVFFKAKNELRGAGHVIMYGDVPRLTFGQWYPSFQLWYDGIALVATVAYAALNMQALLPHMNIDGNAAKALSFIIPSLFSLPFVFMKRARSQTPMTTLASLLIFVALVMMFTVFPYGNVVSETLHTIQHNDTVAVLHLFPLSAQEFFVALSICVFILTPLGRAVPVERTMQPERYTRLLRVSCFVSAVVHIAFGVCAIVSYGSLTCSVLPQSFNRHHPSVEVAVMSLLFFAFLFYIPLNMFELGELCDRRMLGWRSIPRYGEPGPNLLRIFLLVGCSLVAWCIPYYGLLIALSGCFGYSVVAIIVPAALDYVCRARYGLLRGRTLCFLDYVITFSGAALGGIVCVVGMVMTCYEMWLVVQSGYSTTC